MISGEDLARAEPLIASLFKRSRYKGDDGEFFWRVGVLASVGAIPEALVQSACNGAAQNSRRNAVGFARKALTEACAKIGIDLKAMLTAMKMPRLKHRGAPKPKVSELATSLGDALAGGH